MKSSCFLALNPQLLSFVINYVHLVHEERIVSCLGKFTALRKYKNVLF